MKDVLNGRASVSLHINAGLHLASILNPTLVHILIDDLSSGICDQIYIYDDNNDLLVAVQN